VRDEVAGLGTGQTAESFRYGSPACSISRRATLSDRKNHPFIDGNKRTGFNIAVVFLDSTDTNSRRAGGRHLRTMALAAGDLSDAFSKAAKANSKRA
jgi:hypothetical protein